MSQTITTIQRAAGSASSNGLHTVTFDTKLKFDGAINQAPYGQAIATQWASFALADLSVHKDMVALQSSSRKLGGIHE